MTDEICEGCNRPITLGYDDNWIDDHDEASLQHICVATGYYLHVPIVRIPDLTNTEEVLAWLQQTKP